MKRTMLLCLALLLALWSAACGETVSLPESLGVNASQVQCKTIGRSRWHERRHRVLGDRLLSGGRRGI